MLPSVRPVLCGQPAPRDSLDDPLSIGVGDQANILSNSRSHISSVTALDLRGSADPRELGPSERARDKADMHFQRSESDSE